MADFDRPDEFDLPDDAAARDDAAAGGDDDIPLDDIDQPDDYIDQPDDYIDQPGVSGNAETSFITPAGVRRAADAEGLTLEQKVLATAVDDYYDALAKKGITPSLGRDINKFELDVDGRLRLKAHPDINVVNTRTGAPNTLDYVARQKNGGGGADCKTGAGFLGLEARRRQTKVVT